MATIRKRLGKWQVQIRRKNYPNIIKTFIEKSSADKYVREIEVLMDREQFQDLSAATNTTLGDILKRYAYAQTILSCFLSLMIVCIF